ncbi:MAG: hypothetical protein KH452_00345 [Clostridiales bacterium]|nr:hypothetical protein [Clostridiales bacterium]
MSRKSWGITFGVTALAITVALVFWYLGRDTSTPPEEQRGTELVEMLPTETHPERVAASDEEIPREEAHVAESGDYQFLLVNDDSYVAVYKLPEREIYEYTDIIMEVLPVELQEEIQQGKYLKNEEELYNFLENYTS